MIAGSLDVSDLTLLNTKPGDPKNNVAPGAIVWTGRMRTLRNSSRASAIVSRSCNRCRALTGNSIDRGRIS